MEVGHIVNDPVTGVDAENTRIKDDKAAENAIQNEQAAAEELRFQEQCFLVRAITNNTFGKYLRNPTQSYPTFIKVGAKDPTTVMNSLTATRGADEFLTINQKELALLQPMIRIFKVTEARDGSEETIESEYRFDQGSFTLADSSGAGVPSATSFFADRDTRGADVGIESVNFEYMGTQPAEVTNNIRCTIKIFFQNLQSLLAQRYDAAGRSYTFADLILRPAKNEKAGTPDFKWWHLPEEYRIKLVVGWAKPPEYNTGVIRPEVLDALVRTRTVLNLTLKNHTFDFKMDGTSTLECEYHAWAEGALSHPATDLFYPNDEDAKKLRQLKAAEDYSQTQKKQIAEQSSSQKKGLQGGGGTPAPEDPPEKTGAEKQVDDNIEKIREERKEIKAQIRAKAYSRFLDTLLYDAGSNVYYVDVKASQLGKAKTSDDADDQPQQKREDSKAQTKTRCQDLVSDTAIKGNLHYGKIDRAADERPMDADAEEAVKDTLENVADQDLTGGGFLGMDGSVETYSSAALGHLKPGLSPKSNDALRVNFFYFGDLLNACLKILHGNPPAEPGGDWDIGHTAPGTVTRGLPGGPPEGALLGSSEFKNSPASKVDIMTGPMYMTNPCTNELTTINIADVPISVNLFTQWFMNTIIRRQATTYLLRKFIDDCMGTLLPAALGEGCAEGAGRTLLTIQSNVLNIKSDEPNKRPFKRGATVPVESIARRMQAVDWSGPINTKKTYDYLFLYATGFSPNHLGGNKEMDRQNGIYHFRIGSDEGILKSVSFEKSQAPFMAEMKRTGDNNIANDLGGGAIYNAKFELVGNSLFMPGQYIFVDPSSLGVGNPSADGSDGTDASVAYRLRLGGYYFVHKVESTLERGNFTTSIEAKFESGGGKSEAPPPTKAEALQSKLTKDAIAGLELADVDEDDYRAPD